MLKVIVALRDSAARVYGLPFVVQATAHAVRSLRDEVNSKEATSDVARHPEDFELYELATFDEDTGIVSVVEPVRMVCRAKDLKDSS